MDLDALTIERELLRLGAQMGRPVSVVSRTASTSDDAKRAAASGAPHGAAFLADMQTAGRGRGGHTWHSPPGENIYLSVVIRPTRPACAIAAITLAIGLAVARVVERLVRSAAMVALKWPNDVFLDGRKIAGILVEGQLRGDQVVSLVAGIGLNVHARAFPEEIAPRAISLAMAGAEPLDRSTIAAALLAEIGVVSAIFDADGLSPLLAEIRAKDFLRGRDVAIGALRGTGHGIDDAGQLLVRDSSGAVRAVASGEVLDLGAGLARA